MRKYVVLLNKEIFQKLQDLQSILEAESGIKFDQEIIIDSALSILLSKLKGNNHGGSVEN